MQEIHESYKNSNPYLKVFKILELQCLDFVDSRCFLEMFKELDAISFVGNFVHVILLYLRSIYSE